MAIEIPAGIEPRKYQIRVMDRVLEAIDDGHKHILIEQPTGSGKTIVALILAKYLWDEFRYTTGWCAMRRHLLVQAAEENALKIGAEHIKFFSMFDKNPPNVDVLIDDESQHTAAESSVTIYQKVLPKIHLGLTATPFRTDRMKLCFSKIIRDAGIRALIDQGYLSPYHQFVFDGIWSPENVANIYLGAKERWGKTVIFFLTLKECEKCAQIIRDTGTRCEVVWAQSDQERQIKSFIQGEIDVLLNMFILTEGFNCQDLKTVFVRPGSRGPTIQMAGRVFRRHLTKTHAQIVQNSDSKWPFTRVASCEHKFILTNGEWEERHIIGDVIKKASRNVIMAIPKITVKMPEFLKNRHKRKAQVEI